MRILNLYCGIGGNRKLWGSDHEITAVDMDPNILKVYSDTFPNDEVICRDAHKYLLDNFNNFDFIWTSPPCQSHSSFRQNICVRYRGTPAVYPDMSLYQEILFLQYNFKGKYVVENVKPYYKPLVEPSVKLGRHYFWSNVYIGQLVIEKSNIRGEQIKHLQERHDYDLSGYKLKNKRQVLRNCVDSKVGLHILNSVEVTV